jgi:hypothetical protein
MAPSGATAAAAPIKRGSTHRRESLARAGPPLARGFCFDERRIAAASNDPSGLARDCRRFTNSDDANSDDASGDGASSDGANSDGASTGVANPSGDDASPSAGASKLPPA